MRGRGRRGGFAGRGGAAGGVNMPSASTSGAYVFTVPGPGVGEDTGRAPQVLMPTGATTEPVVYLRAGGDEAGGADPGGDSTANDKMKRIKKFKPKVGVGRGGGGIEMPTAEMEVVMPTASGYTMRGADGGDTLASSPPTIVLSSSAEGGHGPGDAGYHSPDASIKRKTTPSPAKWPAPVVPKYWSPKTRAPNAAAPHKPVLMPTASGSVHQSAADNDGDGFIIVPTGSVAPAPAPAPAPAVKMTTVAGSSVQSPSPMKFMKPAVTPAAPSAPEPLPSNAGTNTTAAAATVVIPRPASRTAILAALESAAPTPTPAPAPMPAPVQAAKQGTSELKMVPVFRGGCMYMVTEAEAAAEAALAGGGGEYDDGSGPDAHHTVPGHVISNEELLALTPHVLYPGARRRVFRSQFMPDSLYEHYLQQNRLILAKVEPSDPRYKELPSQFTCMKPLDNAAKTRGATGSLGYVTAVYKVVSSKDGMPYCVRRVDYVRSSHQVASFVMKRWSGITHPGIITLRDCFVYQSAVFFVHDYFPAALTVRERYLDAPGPMIPEPLLWSIACQLATAIDAVHSRDMTFRGVHMDKILITGHSRARISSAGVLDVLEADSQVPLAEYQHRDVVGFCSTLLQLAVRNAHAPNSVGKCVDMISTAYSSDFYTFMYTLFTNKMSIADIVRMLQPRLALEYAGALEHGDALEAVLGQESENGRIARLLIKLGFVNERPDQDGDRTWAETGDRYMLKLFRDYVFHQNDGDGKPMLEIGHVVDCLNRLDIGDATPLLMSSRDERTLLTATFADVRTCLDKAFQDLREPRHVAAGVPAGPGSHSTHHGHHPHHHAPAPSMAAGGSSAGMRPVHGGSGMSAPAPARHAQSFAPASYSQYAPQAPGYSGGSGRSAASGYGGGEYSGYPASGSQPYYPRYTH